MFSNNGARVLDTLLKHIAERAQVDSTKPPILPRIKGVAFDSCPARVSLYQSSRAYTFGVLSPERYKSFFWRMLATGLMYMYVCWCCNDEFRFDFLRYLSLTRGLQWLLPWQRREHVFDSLLRSPYLPKHKLYIYSSKDEVSCLILDANTNAHRSARRSRLRSSSRHVHTAIMIPTSIRFSRCV